MKKKAELILIPSPELSHVVSILEFAKRLIDHDDRISITVLVMKLPPFASSVDAYAKSFAYSRIQLIDLPQVDVPPLELMKSSFVSYITLYVENNIPHVRNIVKDLVSSHSDGSDPVRVSTGVVLHFFCVSVIDVANDFGLPFYIYVSPNAGFLSLILHLSTRQDEIHTEFKPSDSDLSIRGFVNPVPVSVLVSGLFNKVDYTIFVKNISQRFKEANGVIVNTFAELEPYTIGSFSGDLNPPVYTVGPLVNLEGQPVSDLDKAKHQDIFKWLDDQPESSVVFLCFGSAGSFSPAQVKEIATGLEQSEHRFLWSLRVSAPNGDVCVSNQSTSHDNFPEGFLERTGGRGMICGRAPQVEVLAHKAIGGFVSHCGWNSILESLWYGVPIVTWPLYAEQQLNAFRMVKELGLAVELRLDSRWDSDLVMADEIAGAVTSIMDGDSEIRKKVKEISEIGRKSLMDGGSSFFSMKKFIDLLF